MRNWYKEIENLISTVEKQKEEIVSLSEKYSSMYKDNERLEKKIKRMESDFIIEDISDLLIKYKYERVTECPSYVIDALMFVYPELSYETYSGTYICNGKHVGSIVNYLGQIMDEIEKCERVEL